MTNFNIFLSTPQFESFASVVVSAERILQIALSAPSRAPLPKGEARGLPQDGGPAVKIGALAQFHQSLGSHSGGAVSEAD